MHLRTVYFVIFKPGVKRLERETDHSRPFCAELDEWSYTSTPPVRLHAWCLIKQEICLHGVVFS